VGATIFVDSGARRRCAATGRHPRRVLTIGHRRDVYQCR